MNDRGEVTMLSLMVVMILTGLFLLSALRLQASYKKLRHRSHLFLCVKETKGELNRYLIFMGQTNWAIKNISRASLLMFLIPGLQGAALNAKEAKKYIIAVQNLKLISYLKTLNDLKRKGCPLDPRMLVTPFELNINLYKRDLEERVILRKTQWNYVFATFPSILNLKVSARNFERMQPQIHYETSEKMEKLHSYF